VIKEACIAILLKAGARELTVEEVAARMMAREAVLQATATRAAAQRAAAEAAGRPLLALFPISVSDNIATWEEEQKIISAAESDDFDAAASTMAPLCELFSGRIDNYKVSETRACTHD